MEMIDLFIRNVPNDVDLLGNAILEKDLVRIKKMAHHMKSPLSMFNLTQEVAFLEQTEVNAMDSIINSKISEEFTFFKSSLEKMIVALREVNMA